MTDIGQRPDDRERQDRTRQDERNPLQQDLHRLMNGWIDLWQGYTRACQATFNLLGHSVGRAADDLTHTMTDMRRDIRNVEERQEQ